MAFFSKKEVPSHLIPVHPDNLASKDWIILLEAGTIVGPSPERLRVARTTQERRIVKFGKLARGEHYLEIDGYDPRIHGVYFCPQLYKYDADKKLVALQGEEIGRLIARTLEAGIKDRRPWYEPSEKLPDGPVITAPMDSEFDSLIVEMPPAKSSGRS